MSLKCPSCGNDYIAGSDRCQICLHSLMTVDLPKPNPKDALQEAIMTAPISDLLTGKDLLVATKEDSLEHIVSILQNKNKYCVLVYDHKKLVGIVSLRDILLKSRQANYDLSSLKVGDVMTPKPEFVYANTPIAFVVNKMAMGRYRHVPVLASDGLPLSILTIRDVLAYLSRFFQLPK